MSYQPEALLVGETSLLLQFDTNEQVLSAEGFLRANPDDSLREIVPGHDTLLLIGKKRRPDVRIIEGWDPALPLQVGRAHHQILVTYDGQDIHQVADECGLSVTAVIERHTAAVYTVGFAGFAPGFAYLLGGDPQLRPRRHECPRTHVPAGSVALAGEYSAVYPRASPGGWKLIGLTDAVMFDPESPRPSLLAPGDVVRFVERRC